LVDIGEGRAKPSDIPAIIASHNRNRAGRTMPPQGLTLLEVFY